MPALSNLAQHAAAARTSRSAAGNDALGAVLDDLQRFASATDQSALLSYTPATAADWTDPDPTTVKAALDRIASVVAVLNAGPIPLADAPPWPPPRLRWLPGHGSQLLGAGVSTVTYDLLINGLPSGITLALLPAVTSAQQVGISVPVVAGDLLSLRCRKSGTIRPNSPRARQPFGLLRSGQNEC